MTAHSIAKRAYSSPSVLRPARETEFGLLAQATHRLRHAVKASPQVFSELAEALHHNSQIWVALAADVSSDSNQLPADLRARVFYLAEFTRQHTIKVLDGNASARPLLEINVAILKGLGGRSTRS